MDIRLHFILSLTTVTLSPNLSRLRDLIVEDVLDVLDIETSGSYIRG